MSKPIDFNDLIYFFGSKDIAPINFISFKGPFHTYNNTKNGGISIKVTRKKSRKILVKSK